MTATAAALVIDPELGARLAGATAGASRLLGGDAAEPSQLERLIAALAQGPSPPAGSAAPELLREHDEALERLAARFEARFEALARVRAQTRRLRLLTSPDTVLARAPQTLCAASGFQRAIVSLLDASWLRPRAVCFSGDEVAGRVALERLQAAPVRLEHPLIEAELVRRPRATIVLDAQVHPRVHRGLSELMGWSSYAAAPLVVGRRLLGVVHADRGRDAAPDVLDRDVLWEFAIVLAQVYETVSLVRALRDERRQMRGFLEWTAARSAGLTEAPIRLSTVQHAPEPPPSPPEGPLPGPQRDERAVFDGLLTRRELDVLRLLAEGRTNRAIAQALVISDGTVKFHVNGILRKLRVANRAQAVARYLRLLGMPAP